MHFQYAGAEQIVDGENTADEVHPKHKVGSSLF